VELAHHVGVARVDESCGLRAVDRLRESVMKESILDVELVHRPAPREHQSEHGADGGVLHHGTESLIKVHARELGEPPKNPTCLVPVKRTASLKLVLQDPLAGDDVGPWRPWY
jgi:hypothetical protein